MIDVLQEDLIDLRLAGRESAFRNTRTGAPAHIATMYRHAMRGALAVNGERIRLEVVKCPTGLKTSREAIVRFIDRLTNPVHLIREVAPFASPRRGQVERAERELREAGLMPHTEADHGAEASRGARP